MSYAEYQHDTYMKQSDYKKLREMLGFQDVEMNSSLCYVHCVPALKKNFETLMEQDKSLNCNGCLFAENGIFCEPFNQMDTYGNGLDFCIIVPDYAVSQMRILYSLLSVITETQLDNHDLQNIAGMCEGLFIKDKKQRQDSILHQLGMNRHDITRMNRCQTALLFLLPLVPALIISSCFVYISAEKMQLIAFHLPVFSSNLWMFTAIGVAFGFFILLYSVYFIAVEISYRREENFV